MKTCYYANRHALLAVLIAVLIGGVPAAAQSDAGLEQTAFHGEACGDGCCDAGCGDECCGDECCGCADGCRKICVATVEKEKVEKHRWKTEPRDVCIPKVILPWQEGGSGLTIFNFLKKHKANGCGDACCGDACCEDGCEECCCKKPRCGKVITVCDLKKEKYEKEECVYKWEVRRLPPCCDDGCCEHGGGCGDAGCGDTCGSDVGCQPAWGANPAPASNEVQLASMFTLESAPAKTGTQATK